MNNVEFFRSDDTLSKVAGKNFDLVNTYIVLQHINVSRGEKLIATMLDLLNAKGVGAIHVTYHRDKPAINKAISYFRVRVPFLHNVFNILQGKPLRTPLRQMNGYDVNKILTMLYRAGITNSYLRLTNHDGSLGVQLIFQKPA